MRTTSSRASKWRDHSGPHRGEPCDLSTLPLSRANIPIIEDARTRSRLGSASAWSATFPDHLFLVLRHQTLSTARADDPTNDDLAADRCRIRVCTDQPETRWKRYTRRGLVAYEVTAGLQVQPDGHGRGDRLVQLDKLERMGVGGSRSPSVRRRVRGRSELQIPRTRRRISTPGTCTCCASRAR